MFEHDLQFVSNLVEHCSEQLDLIKEFDSYADDFAALFEQHKKLSQKLAPLLTTIKEDHKDSNTKAQKRAKKVLDANGNELTGAALEANLVINAILDQYKNKTAQKQKQHSIANKQDLKHPLAKLSNVQSIYTDAFKFVRHFSKLEANEIFDDMLSPDSISHDALVENIILMSHVQSIALNRQIIHITKETNKYCDLNCLLNTSDVLDNMPTWSLVFDLSQCHECAPIEGLIISRITYLKDGKQDMPFTSSHNDEDIFLEELGLTLNIKGQWFTLGLAATLDNDRTISDLVRELGYYALDQLEQIEVPPLSKREQLDEPNWDESEQIIDPKLNNDDFAKALYHAFKYLTYTITHLDLITDDKGNNVALTNESKYPAYQKSDDLIATLTDRLTKDTANFKHYFI